MPRTGQLLGPMHPELAEAGCDEAGRGCLAGPVFAAAVILPSQFRHPLLNDSKKMSRKNREVLRGIIEKEAIAWAVEAVGPEEIDKINILEASITAMHRAILKLNPLPDYLLIDGNRFKPVGDLPYTTVVKGDATYLSIAAASVLAKTHRDEYMDSLSREYPQYGWVENKGYPTAKHLEAILDHGFTPHHRRSFHPKGLQKLF